MFLNKHFTCNYQIRRKNSITSTLKKSKIWRERKNSVNSSNQHEYFIHFVHIKSICLTMLSKGYTVISNKQREKKNKSVPKWGGQLSGIQTTVIVASYANGAILCHPYFFTTTHFCLSFFIKIQTRGTLKVQLQQANIQIFRWGS